jgi:DNA-binding HxlR family transcriptional regulator
MTQPTTLGAVKRKSFEAMNCSVAQCLEVIGEWWSMLIVRDTFLGVRRFDDFQARLGISRNILTARLTSLVEAGVLDKVPYQERPLRHEYRLTAKGRDLWSVLTTMREWGDKWAAPGGAPLELVHDACGEIMALSHNCSTCGGAVDSRSVRARPGPGAHPDDFADTPLVAHLVT